MASSQPPPNFTSPTGFPETDIDKAAFIRWLKQQLSPGVIDSAENQEAASVLPSDYLAGSVYETASQAAAAMGRPQYYPLWSPVGIYHATYSFARDGGAVGILVPGLNASIPKDFVIQNVAINSTVALTSGGAATVAIGLSGISGNDLLAATGYASFSLGAFVQGIPVPSTASTWVKLGAAAELQLTIAGAALTAGYIEIYVQGYLSAS